MARRLRFVNSPNPSRQRFFRPQVDRLEDRLPPGSILNVMSLGSADLSANFGSALEPADTGHEAPVLTVVQSPAPQVVYGASAGSEAAPATQPVFVWTPETNQLTTSQPLGGDPLAWQPDFAVSFGDELNTDGLGLAKAPDEHLPQHMAQAAQAAAAGRFVDIDTFASGSVVSIQPTASLVSGAAGTLSTDATIPLGDFAQLSTDTATDPQSERRVPRGAIPDHSD